MGPEAFDQPAETALELWERIKRERPDRFEGAKRISRACEVGLLPLVKEKAHGATPWAFGLSVDGRTQTDRRSTTDPITVVKVALWETSDTWAVVGMPRWIFAGFQAQMMKAGAQRCQWGVLLAGGVWRKGAMSALPEAWADLSRAADAFAQALEKGVPPQPVGPIDLDVIKRMFPEDDGTTVTLPEDARRLWERAKALRKSINRDKKARARVESKLRSWMGSATVGKMGGLRLGLRTLRAPGGRRGRRLVEIT